MKPKKGKPKPDRGRFLQRSTVKLYENSEIRFQENDKLWHKLTDEGPEFKCKACGRLEVVTWDDIRQTITILAQHPGETWNLLCVGGKSLMLARPDAQLKLATKLVSVTLENGMLVFSS